MYLLGNLLVAFLPSMRHPKAPAYRRLVRETQAYDPWLDDYEPYAANHESPSWTSTKQRARIVYERVIAAEAGRLPKTLAFLERNGFYPTADPATWDALGEWLANNVEGSREPGSDRYSPQIHDYPGGRAPTSVEGVSTSELRPKLNGLVFDLGLLLGRRMIEAAPGARWASESELTGEDSLVAEPRIVLANGVNITCRSSASAGI